jgi:predicted nucleotidyltransferase
LEALGCFGSVVRQEANTDSDVDVDRSGAITLSSDLV